MFVGALITFALIAALLWATRDKPMKPTDPETAVRDHHRG